ncbi:NADP-dependent malic enzyme [Rhodobacteraceae bacterium DSL-40]|uniref:NADP-dependent malic enzyme n=1 Tax=Amaricoccus sp. B4 TaxID=3368557 RepID=UPI000DAF2862
MSEDFRRDALAYHSAEPRGKLQILPTKPMATQRDLALAYSPGVAVPCEEIAADPSKAALYTGRANLVAVISNGTAVLGLGNIGALASKPVMEGKAALFKKFSGIDVVDLEVDETDVDAFCETVRRLEPSFGGINLEDIAAPACFEIESRLKREMGIPVFHDDQHGTAIVAAAGMINGLDLVGKSLEEAKIVCNGAGAAALACIGLLVSFGARKENILVCDSKGVVHSGRAAQLDKYKTAWMRDTEARTLADAMKGADVFLGVSVARAVDRDMVASMAPNPLIFALANPEPEIRPEEVEAVRSDAIVATGRSDYPNQVNNVLCFPFIFRGALDVGATEINDAMKRACAEAIARIARAEAADMQSAYANQDLKFGPNYIIPKPFDSRLMLEIAPLVAQTAMDTGVATLPIEDMAAYREKLQSFVYRSGMLMKPVFERAQRDPRRVVFAEGDSTRVLHAASRAARDGIARPVLVGNAEAIRQKIAELSLSLTIGKEIEVADPEKIDPQSYADQLHRLVGRDGISPKEALRGVRSDPSVFAFLMLERGEVDAAICGTGGRFAHHLTRLKGIIGLKPGATGLSTMNALVMPSGTFFIADAYVSVDPSAEEVADLAIRAAEAVRRMGLEPRAALVSHANFGDRPSASSRKMRRAVEILRQRQPDFEFDGEMHADTALVDSLRAKALPGSSLRGPANLFIMPNADAAHISLTLLKTLGGAVPVGPIMMGAAKPAYIASQSVTVRGLLNLTALAVVEAQASAEADENRLAAE